MTTRRFTVRRESWPLARPFAISRGVKTAAEVLVCEIVDGRAKGRGECVPYARYGETLDSVSAEIAGVAARLEAGADRAEIAALLKPGAARNVIDCALWDLDAKQADEPAWQRAGLPPPQAAITAYTISLDTPEAMGAAAAEAATRPLLKLKLGADDPVACVAAVRRSAPNARLIADPNEGWSFEQLRAIAPELVQLGLELVEQPIPAADDHQLVGWTSPLILCADESFHVAADIAALSDRYSAVNIKLDKAGGFTEAVACLRAAEAAGLKIMVGCMVATSLAMAPAALLAGSATYVDLDGPLLLKQDRGDGIVFDGSLMHPPPRTLWG
ncbi:L-Ala-D/L-Glu epimerase [Alphaproteobacteria bacterium SO-S41]|nr:L-Ala-D/L-Glu epimerase [Alphaproteobacteria bacterium SO-S41]